MTQSSDLSTSGPQVTAQLERVATGPLDVPTRLRFDSIDGLRGAACLMVVFYHCWSAFGQPWWASIHLAGRRVGLPNILERGWGGVDVFFVLSGFCLSFPIVSRPDKPTDWKRYFKARFRRILPPYWCAIALFLVLGVVVRHWHLRTFMNNPAVHWPGRKALLACLALISIGPENQVLNGSFWTLLVEWRWYFLFPLLIWVWRRFRGSGVFAVGVAASALYLVFLAHRNLPTLKFWMNRDAVKYLPLFCGGIWAAQMTAHGPRTRLERLLVRYAPLGVALSIVLVFFSTPDGTRNVPRLLTWGPFAVFSVIAAVNNRHVCRALCWRPLVWVGIFSYSLYVVHQPFAVAVADALKRHGPFAPPAVLALHLLLLPAFVLALGFLFFLVAERPFLARRKVVRLSAPVPTSPDAALAAPPSPPALAGA